MTTSIDSIVAQLVSTYSHHRATDRKSNICEILGTITDINHTSPALQDPIARSAIDLHIFTAVCEQLGIARCPANEIFDLVSCCCPFVSGKKCCPFF